VIGSCHAGVCGSGSSYPLRPSPGQSFSGDPVLRQQQVEHRRDQVTAEPERGYAAPHRLAALPAGVEARQVDREPLGGAVEQRQRRFDPIEPQVPSARLAVAVANRAARNGGLARRFVEHDRFPLGVL